MVLRLIIGPNIEIDNDRLNELSRSHSRELIIHGNGQSPFDIRAISAFENDTIIINAHGGSSNDGRHQIGLHSSLGFESGLDYTSYNFQKIAESSEDKPVNVELFSCYSGGASTDLVHLPLGSSLITFTSSQDLMLLNVVRSLVEQSINFEGNENPFKRFNAYLCSNPDTNTFSIKTKDDCKHFTSDINTLTSYTEEGIKKWQSAQISKFISFLTSNIHILPDQAQTHMHQIQLPMEHQREKWCNKFDAKKFQKFLMMNLVNQGNTENALKLISTVSTLWHDPEILEIAIAAKNPSIIDFLGSCGMDMNIRILNDEYPLMFAIREKSGVEVVETLINRGADVNCAGSDGLTALDMAVREGNLDITKLLLDKDAKLNEGHLIDVIGDKNIAMVKLLLSAGISTKACNLEGLSGGGDITAIKNEMVLYNASPVNYVITNNTDSETKIKSLKRLLTHTESDRVKTRCNAIIQVEELNISGAIGRSDSNIPILAPKPRRPGHIR